MFTRQIRVRKGGRYANRTDRTHNKESSSLLTARLLHLPRDLERNSGSLDRFKQRGSPVLNNAHDMKDQTARSSVARLRNTLSCVVVLSVALFYSTVAVGQHRYEEQ